MQKRRVRERTFKRLAFASTLVGVIVMAIGLQQGLLSGRWILAGLLFLLGGAIALSSVMLEVVPEAGFVVTLYTRQECSLCDAARAFLVGKRREYDYDIWEVDVDKDAAAGARYSDWVPVAVVAQPKTSRASTHAGAVDGEELFRAVPDYVRLEQRLRALADARLRR
jgi:hypothetical protein